MSIVRLRACKFCDRRQTRARNLLLLRCGESAKRATCAAEHELRRALEEQATLFAQIHQIVPMGASERAPETMRDDINQSISPLCGAAPSAGRK